MSEVQRKKIFKILIDSDILESIAEQMNAVMNKGYEPKVLILWKAYIAAENPDFRVGKKVIREKVIGEKVNIMGLETILVDYECCKVY